MRIETIINTLLGLLLYFGTQVILLIIVHTIYFGMQLNLVQICFSVSAPIEESGGVTASNAAWNRTHRMFGHMHGALNVVKKITNYTV